MAFKNAMQVVKATRRRGGKDGEEKKKEGQLIRPNFLVRASATAQLLSLLSLSLLSWFMCTMDQDMIQHSHPPST
jgi:hypothetical protein